MKTAITGASGQLGRLVVEHLKDKAEASNLVALVRKPEKIKDLGVEARSFDYNQPEGLAESLKDVETLLLISGNEVGKRETQHKNVINAAKEAGVKRIVYTSLLHADQSTLVLAPEHYATEKAIKDSGIDYTILRNGWYTENYSGFLPSALKSGALIGSAGEGKISSAARKDYAEAAAKVLAETGHEGKTYELAGDTSYTLSDLAAELSSQTGKDIPYNNLSQEAYAGALKEFGMPEETASVIASFDQGASQGDLFDEGKVLSGLIGRPTTPLSQVVKEAIS